MADVRAARTEEKSAIPVGMTAWPPNPEESKKAA